MAVTQKPIVVKNSAPDFYCTTGDTKPTQALHPGVSSPEIGNTLLNITTDVLYVTYDGTNWLLYITLG